MPRKKPTAEEIIGKLREAEVLLTQGKKVPEISRILGVPSRPIFAGARSMVVLGRIRPDS